MIISLPTPSSTPTHLHSTTSLLYHPPLQLPMSLDEDRHSVLDNISYNKKHSIIKVQKSRYWHSITKLKTKLSPYSKSQISGLTQYLEVLVKYANCQRPPLPSPAGVFRIPLGWSFKSFQHSVLCTLHR